MRRIACSAVLMAAAVIAAPAQMVVSAHSGTVHYIEGDVSIDGVALKSQPGHFDELKEQSVLRTARGRAEILLTPGVFLRVGENSSVRMLDNRLASTRIEMLAGSATVETDTSVPAAGKYQTPPVTLLYKDYDIQPVKDGLFEIASDPAQVRVFKGEASVHAGDNRVTVKDGHEVFLTAALAMEKFDEKTAADDNYLWARDRSAEVSAANMSSARTLANGGGYGYSGSSLGFGGYGGGFGGLGGYSPYWASSLWGASMFGGGWYYNPMFDMYTYMPVNGYGFSPFGYGFYSPMVINSVYTPASRTWYGGGGARTSGVIGRPISGSGGITRGTSLSSSSLFRSTSSANVISSRMANSAMARSGEGFGRGGSNAAGFSGGAARSAGPAMSGSAGGFSRGGGGGGAAGGRGR